MASMSTSINIGKARVFNFAVSAGGNPDNTTSASVAAGNGALIRTTMNPTNNRQFAVVALAATAGINANVTCASITAHALITVPAAPVIDSVVIDEAGVGPEVDPSTIPWA